MKITVVLIIITISFYVGYSYKQKQQVKYELLLYIKNYATFLKSNINLFKVNLVQIIEDYISLQNEKNAKFNSIFVKNSEIYCISRENIEKFGLNNQDNLIIFNFLNSIGKNSYEFEDDKINDCIAYLDKKIEEYSSYVKTKGELTLKIALAIGCVISIIIW